MNKKVLISIGLMATLITITSWTRPNFIFENEEDVWVDNLYNSMTLEEKLGQLFMVAAYSNKGTKHEQFISELITKYKIGGLIFFQGGPKRQIRQTNYYQSISKTPLLIAMDAEWGLNMRLKDSTLRFPRQMVLGAIQDNEMIYKMGESMADECRRLGVHVNFAPVVDVNVNPKNPVIGTRSFGENKVNVAQKGIAITKGMQDNRVIGVAKHFPGHGDTDKDSHLALPVIKHNRKRLDDVEMYPFREMFAAGVKGVMVAHLQIPALDKRKNRATTLSYKVVTKILQEELKYKGLIFTDALNMKGVSEFNKPGVVDEMAFLAGNDVLLFPENVPIAIQKLKKAYQKGKISEERLAKSVKKILKAKYWAGLSNYKPILVENVYQDLINKKREALIEELYAQAITVVRNEENILPIQKNKFKKIACINMTKSNTFGTKMQDFDDVTVFDVPSSSDAKRTNEVYNKTKDFDLIVVGVGKMNNSRGKNYGLSTSGMSFMNKLNQRKNVVIAVFGNPYSLRNFDRFKNIICAYNENEYTIKNVPQAIFGARKANGKLPVTASENAKEGQGIEINPLHKLGFAMPETQQMNSDTLNLIDSIVKQALEMKAAPGCQVLVARNGKVVYQKSFGFFTYDNKKEVINTTVYDLASITKVASTLQAVMKLYEEGKIDVYKKASFYLPELIGSNKENMIIKDILLHQAGLTPFIPHWANTMTYKKTLDTSFYCFKKDSIFCCQVAGNIFCKPDLADSVWQWTISSDLRTALNEPLVTKKKRRKKNRIVLHKPLKYDYKYSDLGFYIMKAIVEKQSKSTLENYTAKIYKGLGLDYLTYNPTEKYSSEIIAPTEKDTYFRNQLITGFVHDQGAAMLGGVGGHAGLFSNAYDLAQLMQMNLQKGFYDGKAYFNNDTTIAFFAKKQVESNRRGLGWDKPFENNVKNGSTSYMSSSEAFGHSGFTGTCVWVDPKYNLMYVFLSNRVYPDASNKKLYIHNIRTNIHDVIYRSMEK